MKYKLLISILLASTFIPGTYAQGGNGKIIGIIKDPETRAIPGATVTLVDNKDSALKRTSITDANGVFRFFNLSNGAYALIISHVGFERYKSANVLLSDSITTVQLPPVFLHFSSARLLQQVIVTSKKSMIEQKIDRTVVNVDAMLNTAGSNALDVLSKSPGVIVDENGGISLNGKNNVWVLIDDRPTYMSGNDLAAYLRSLPAGVLEKLELISNPPARYDASGNAIINIVLKKNTIAGFNGALNIGYNQGMYARSNDALNVNYRTKKFNLFGNLGYSHDQNYSKETYSRFFYKMDGSQDGTTLQNSFYSYRSNGFNNRVGWDYFASPKTTVGIILMANIRPKTDLLNYAIHQFDSALQPDSITKGYTSGNYNWRNSGVNLNFQQKLDSSGRMLTANLDYLNYHSANNQASPLDTYDANGFLKSSQQRFFTFPSEVNIYAGKVEYTLPLKSKAEFSAGIKNSYTTTNAESNWFNNNNGNLVPDYSKTSHFLYTENISSAYANLRKEWKRWAVQCGLRLETTLARGHQFMNPVNADTSFTKQYSNLFPSLYISYKLDSNGNNTLVLNYSKRLRRPGYQQVNPFLFFIDQNTFSSGNPDLTAAFAQYVELRYSYKHFFGVTLSYGGGSKGINPLTKADGNIFITIPYNFIDNTLYGIIPYVSLKPFPWWSLNLNAVLLYLVNKGRADGIIINQRTNVQEIEISNHFQLGKTWTAELSGFFPGRQAYGQTKNGSIYNISFGVQKEILHKNGTVRFNMNDIFHSLPVTSQTIGINQVAAFSYKEKDSRWAGISFIYRFGKSANARKRNDNGSADEEKNRVN
jgi:hypothetical protein